MAKVVLRIDEVLEERGQSAYWLANELGLGHGNLYRYRKGQVNAVNLDLLARMCVLLECQPGDLLVLVDQKQAVERKPRGKRKIKGGGQ
jgi:putative transcriptional regulator